MKTMLYKFRRILLCTMSALFYGFLAYIANMDKGFDPAMKAALVQGSLSTVLVFCSSLMMEYFFTFGSTLRARFCASFFISGSIVFIVFLSAHWLMNTPNLFKTLLYGVSAGVPYYLAYPYALVRHEMAQSAASQ